MRRLHLRKTILAVLAVAFTALPISSHAASTWEQKFPFLAKIPRVRAAEGDYVVVVHGLTWARATMRRMGAFLHSEDYHTVEVHYPSRSIGVDEIVADYLLPAIREHCPDKTRRIHFVGHSMGSIMVRRLLAEHKLPNLGRVVLLAAPNRGIEMADFFTKAPALRRLLGASVTSMGVGPTSVPNQLGPVDFSPGIIMGTKGDFPMVSRLIPGEDDGVVRVESGRVRGMKELILVPTTHIRMPNTGLVRLQTLSFLQNGSFDRIAHERSATRKRAPSWNRITRFRIGRAVH